MCRLFCRLVECVYPEALNLVVPSWTLQIPEIEGRI